MDTEIDCHGIRASSEGLHELDESRVVVTVPRDAIRDIELRHGVSSERLALVFAFGLVLFVVAVGIAVLLVLWFMGGGVAYDVEFALLLLGPLGVWLMRAAVRRRFFLYIQTDTDRRKLSFTGDATLADLKTFADRVGLLAGRPIRMNVDPAR